MHKLGHNHHGIKYNLFYTLYYDLNQGLFKPGG